MKNNDWIYIFLNLLFFVASRLFVYKYLPIYGIGTESLFITDLLGFPLKIPATIILLADFVNFGLLSFLIGKLLGKNYGRLAGFIYSINPWTFYLSLYGSIFVLIMNGVMFYYCSLYLLNNRKLYLGILFLVIGWTLTLIVSFSFLIVAPLLILGWHYLINSKKIKKVTYLFGVSFLIILILCVLNKNNFINIFNKEITLFHEVKLINSLNTFQGELGRLGFRFLGKLIENKITYMGRHVVFNILTVLSPYTYFTSQFKLLGFSNSPPVLLGFLIPFIYFILNIFKYNFNKKYLLITIPLLIPTVLKSYSPNLQSLVLISPIIIYAITRGIKYLIDSNKKVVLVIMIFLILLQTSTIIFDVMTREPLRYQNTVNVTK